MTSSETFIQKVLEKGLEPKEVFQEAVFKKFGHKNGDTSVIDRWEDIWAFCMFYGEVPDFIMEYVKSLE